jgi:hypothetical protein
MIRSHVAVFGVKDVSLCGKREKLFRTLNIYSVRIRSIVSLFSLCERSVPNGLQTAPHKRQTDVPKDDFSLPNDGTLVISGTQSLLENHRTICFSEYWQWTGSQHQRYIEGNRQIAVCG